VAWKRDLIPNRNGLPIPLFYVSVTSVTDNSAAPQGYENLFAYPRCSGFAGVNTEELRDRYFDTIVKRFEHERGKNKKENIVYKKSYSVSNFVDDYNSFRGNAYGWQIPYCQTAILTTCLQK